MQSLYKEALAQLPSAPLSFEEFDRASEVDVERFFTAAVQTLGRIDLAINLVAQTGDGSKASGLSIDQYDSNFLKYQRGVRIKQNHVAPVWKRLSDLSWQTFLIERALLRQMLKQDILEGDCRGSIVNVVDYGPTPSLAEYPVVAAVASAIIGFSKTDACDYAQDKIRVNVVAASEILIQKEKPELPGGVPIPRLGRPDDISNTVAWLSLPSSSWLTGLVVPVDGGRHLNHFW